MISKERFFKRNGVAAAYLSSGGWVEKRGNAIAIQFSISMAKGVRVGYSIDYGYHNQRRKNAVLDTNLLVFSYKYKIKVDDGEYY